ncbi:DUF4148 domain-containing protein [Paraburkholderia sp. MMS20-SJTN17]|uniref:DUF4148 domain-containing protein n=1 Tax=Paraburkholderia translucens TaxID=2886945 RepID=A0ABS8KI97_9BURK|nr:DUF4148 domain-containing protein [Paraburkholderia sp. MMS20-SJTN17]MCC8404447.1 DUF4148 domain-containing protein [Paraburkholderia sp. MMS20-SJTN17]
MKSLIKAVAIAAVLAAPVASFAQASQQPVTRAEVRNELIQLEHAGYNPATSNDTNYPADIQAAEQRLQAQNPAVAQTQPTADTSGYGAPMSGSTQAGGMAQPITGQKSVYFGN